MDPRISLVTLGVRDLARATAFYREGLEFPLWPGSSGDVSFFRTGGAVLALYSWEKLAEDALIPPAGSGFRGVALAHNVPTRAEVSEVLAQAVAAGAKLIKPAQDVFWGGHSGYFADPDGHLWEVAWNPGFPLAADGSVTLP